ncbi:signal peptidase I [Leifsonia aquatica]|uniref:Signal peptidase I n=2 Tax=Leifsonia aquatica TaxID=144185 RepID=U2RWX8_LEIAQ|nr:signal peptidase I [Leifsonia aquatica]ERK73271.1 signal peptidase I [Leifsonia aquatica ATCC 14665]MBB2967679.1 signal peptidase [Leifsonia aquatica]
MSPGWRVYAGIRNVLLTAGAVVGGACILIFALGMFLGVKPAIVVSGSMLPTIPVGAMTFSLDRPASQLEVGDVVMVERPDDQGLVTHRIVELEKTGGRASLTLQGDNNDVTDPEPYLVKQAAVVVFTVPLLGYIADYVQRQGILVGVILLSVIAALLVLDPARLGRRREGEPESGTPSSPETTAELGVDDELDVAQADPMTRPRSARRAVRKENAQ